MGLSSVLHVDLFAGSGMLGMAGRICFGEWLRTVCYVEREAYAQANLVARMDDEALDRAPVWDDVGTFGAREVAEVASGVDFITGGFPCQDLSCAGKREGIGAARSGLFFEILRIAGDCADCFDGEWPVLFLENVPGIFSSTTTAILEDPPGGGLQPEIWASIYEELACSIVGRSLAESGYDSIWLPLGAGEVGASHKRLRWWCLAYREDSVGWGKLAAVSRGGWGGGLGGGGGELGNSEHGGRGEGCEQGGWPARDEIDGSSSDVGQAEGGTCRQGWAEYEGFGGSATVAESGGALADGQGGRCAGIGVSTRSRRRGEGKRNANRASAELADNPELFGEAFERGEPVGVGGRIPPLFAPGPGDARWPEIVERWPDVEPAVYRMVVGMASRVDRLRLAGGGVAPLAAAVALGLLVDFASGVE